MLTSSAQQQLDRVDQALRLAATQWPAQRAKVAAVARFAAAGGKQDATVTAEDGEPNLGLDDDIFSESDEG